MVQKCIDMLILLLLRSSAPNVLLQRSSAPDCAPQHLIALLLQYQFSISSSEKNDDTESDIPY
jgi:hypothetical protein